MNAPRIHKLWPTVLALVAPVLALIGERIYAGNDTGRLGFAVAAAVALGAALVARLNEFLSASADKKPVLRNLIAATLSVAIGLAIYALIPLALEDGNARVLSVAWAIWPVVLALGLFPLVAIEFAVAPVAFIERYELKRIAGATQRSVGLALLTAVLVFANFLANRHEAKVELATGNVAQPATETVRAIQELTKPVKVVLFFSRANEVAEAMERYFAPLVALNPNLTVERVDHALAATLARDADVSENGYVALIHEQNKDKIRLGTNLRAARPSMRRFDANFLRALAKITIPKQIAYYTTGHGERALDTPDKEDRRQPMRALKRSLEAWQYTVRPLGVAEGLAQALPKDASVILILGPDKAFLPAEIEVLQRGYQNGARILLLADAEQSADIYTELLKPLGLKLDATLLANEQANAQMTRTLADNAFIYSNKYSSHESVTTMTRAAGRLAAVFFRSGSLEKEEGSAFKTEMVITSVDETFRDLNANLLFDRATEKKERYNLAAAVTKTSTSGKKADETRIFVTADADLFGDDLTGLVQGNGFLFRDVMTWLSPSEDVAIPTIPEEDVKIVHKKEDDQLIFYGTTFGVPGLVLLAGVFATRRKRR